MPETLPVGCSRRLTRELPLLLWFEPSSSRPASRSAKPISRTTMPNTANQSYSLRLPQNDRKNCNHTKRVTRWKTDIRPETSAQLTIGGAGVMHTWCCKTHISRQDRYVLSAVRNRRRKLNRRRFSPAQSAAFARCRPGSRSIRGRPRGSQKDVQLAGRRGTPAPA